MPVTDDRATTGRDIDELPRLPGVPLAGSAPAASPPRCTGSPRARTCKTPVHPRPGEGPVGRRLGLTVRPVGLSARITPR
jgi:hypothetical protein